MKFIVFKRIESEYNVGYYKSEIKSENARIHHCFI